MFIILKILIKYTKLMIFLNKLKLLKSIALKKKPKLVNMKLKHKDKILMYAHFSQNSIKARQNTGMLKYICMIYWK